MVDKQKEYFDKLHKGRFSGSNLGCPRAQALRISGYEPVISKRMSEKFSEGREHDEEMKHEAMEDFEDFYLPGSVVVKLKRGDTVAEISATPDGLREEEVVEFKGLSASFWNSIRDVDDLKDGSPLARKYYKQTQAYAGIFKKPKIRFRIKNKRNLKTKDILYDADPEMWTQIKNEIIDVQELLDAGELPPKKCSKQEEKYCFYKKDCLNLLAEKVEETQEKELDPMNEQELNSLLQVYIEIKEKISELEIIRKETADNMKEIMKSFGKREVAFDEGEIKYGIRYKVYKNKEDIDKLVEEGKIKTEERAEEYLAVYPTKKEEEE